MSESINREEQGMDSLLADYLGGEMPAEQHDAFETTIRRDPALAAEVASMRQAIHAMQSTVNDSGSLFSRKTGKSVADRPSAIRTALRYAAAIALAFVTGYFVRGGGGVARNDQLAGEDSAATITINRSVPSGWEQRAGEAYVKADGNSGLGRSLIALSQIAQH